MGRLTPAGVPILVLLLLLPQPAAAGGRPGPVAERRWAGAIEALGRGDPAPALREFAEPGAARSAVGDYLGFLRAEALVRVGDLAGARRAAEALASAFPEHLVAPAALLLAAHVAARAGDEAGEEALLRRFLERYAGSPETPKALYLLGAALEAQGEGGKAAQTDRELTLLAPGSAWGDAAEDRLRALAAQGFAVRPLSPEERLARAERLLRGGQAEAARGEAQAVADSATNRDLALRALDVVARALAHEHRYDAAAEVVEREMAEAPVTSRPGLQLELGRLLYHGGRPEQALAALTGVAASRAPEAPPAAYLEARVLEEAGRLGDAALDYERMLARFPRDEVVAPALWRLGWLAYLRDERARAAGYWARLGDLPAAGSYHVPATYWTARAREEAGAPAEAARLYERVLAEAPHGYYGILAAQRVKEPVRDAKAPPFRLPAEPARALAADPDYVRAETLRRLGLTEWAFAEMDDIALRSIADPVKLYWLSTAYQREERYDLSLRIVRRFFADVTAGSHAALPAAFWRTVYPLGWRAELTRAAARAGIDPFLLAAVVREESSFYPRARSRAGARGLMQLLPRTAQVIAARRGLDLGGGDMLDEPEPNLRIGAAMLAELLREFPDPRLAIAAYNAGPAHVREWWVARRTDDVDAFVEQIPYEETRWYVRRVVAAWAEYRRLYGRDGGR